MSQYRRVCAFYALLLLPSMILAVPSHKLDKTQTEYGYSAHYGTVTPANVYAITHDFNRLLKDYTGQHLASKYQALAALKPQKFQDKTPTDVFNRMTQLADLVDNILKSHQLPPVRRVTLEKSQAVPAEPYLAIGNILDGFVTLADKQSPGQQWGQYYRDNTLSKQKTPSDVYSEVDLAVRRLQLISK